MATYNGAEYVAHQLRSILDELAPQDDVVVVDDASSDDTVAIIEAMGDPRVRVIRQSPNRGYVRTFESAMLNATGDVLLLADQDDEWIAGRRDALVEAALASGVAASNLVLLGSGQPLRSPIGGRPWLLRSSDSVQRLRNELRILAGVAPYFGCAMAVRRDMLPVLTPFPAYLSESHDLWIATAANEMRALRHVEQATVRRRIHDSNASSSAPRGLRAALRSRLMLARAWADARRRVRSR
ncbi:glycosyltransferase [Microbacterium rhizomatis]|uniref:Glycosyltransferase n=2 Tax=Microbacterium rhizomatis TaxID=1631477 RepID=A0A5J5J6D2_9MICO|nr:glycosyltransferase [Microbacterium rhizomatis]